MKLKCWVREQIKKMVYSSPQDVLGKHVDWGGMAETKDIEGLSKGFARGNKLFVGARRMAK
jgi:hypothetical protein